MFEKKDFIVGLISVLLGIGIIIQSYLLVVKTQLDPAGPKAVPVIIGISMIVIGLINLYGGGVARRRSHKEDVPKSSRWFQQYRPVLLISLFSLAYAGLLEALGYLLLTPLLIGSIMWVLEEKNIRRVIQVSLLMTVILFAVFTWGLQVKFPMGILLKGLY